MKRKENLPTTSKNAQKNLANNNEPPKKSCCKMFCEFLYDSENKLFCERTCTGWFILALYSIMYLILLAAFTMLTLYVALLVIHNRDFEICVKPDLYTYTENGIGLTATPTSVDHDPIIWYHNEPVHYDKYVKSIQKLLEGRRKEDVSLGPCGTHPYGYGDKPCVIVRINKQLHWSAKPLSLNSSNATNVPDVVWNWMKLDKQKYWLVCSGYNSFDKEHIKSIQYHPYPPGFDASLYPMNMTNDAPLVAIQLNEFTLGLSLTVQCELWYEGGVSRTSFLLYRDD